MQHKCKNTDDIIACIPNKDYEGYVNDICTGFMPWAKVDTYAADDKIEDKSA